jgi:chromosomal replication initiation ATPase DnaA
MPDGHELRRLGFDLVRIAERVAEIYEIETSEIFLKGKQPKRVKARSLFCYWAVGELGVSLTELARQLNSSVSGVGYSVDRDKLIARENGCQLVES